MRTAKVNQKALAERLQLSTATISKCLSNHPDISLETRARVLDAATQLGYRMRRNGEGRHERRTQKRLFVAVLFYTYDAASPGGDPPGTGFLTGLSQAAEADGVTLLVHRYGKDSPPVGPNRPPPPALQPGLAKGLVLIHRPPPDATPWLTSRLPCVSLVHRLPGRVDRVDADHAAGLDDAVSHLVELGHRRIGFYGRGPARSYSQERFGSFIGALTRHRLPLAAASAVNVIEDTADLDRQVDLVENRLREGVRAWVCASDRAGYELCRRLLARGHKVPADVSLVGVDGIEPLFGCPRLTTVKLPFIAMGAAALKLVAKRIREPQACVERVSLLPTFHVHETTAGPSNG